MVRDATNLVWLDMEMTGLNPEADRIIEFAMVVTDSNLEVVAESPVWAIHQTDATLEAMDDWNKKTHTRSGLIERVRASTHTEAGVEAEKVSPMCENSICQDRRFMAHYMPTLESWFHYRNLDVSTLKELCKRWTPAIYKGFQKKGSHTALADIYESIDELKYYRQHFIRS
jgi:oligoribonuclease